MDCTQLSNAFNIVLQETPMIDKKKLHCDNSAQSAWLDVWQRVLTFSNNTFKELSKLEPSVDSSHQVAFVQIEG